MIKFQTLNGFAINEKKREDELSDSHRTTQLSNKQVILNIQMQIFCYGKKQHFCSISFHLIRVWNHEIPLEILIYIYILVA